MDETNETIEKVHQTINDHKNKDCIDCIKKKVEKLVSTVVYKRLQIFPTYVLISMAIEWSTSYYFMKGMYAYIHILIIA